MALQGSGQISLNDVNVELGNSGTSQISLGDADVRDLFGVASGAISLSDGYGATNNPYYLMRYALKDPATEYLGSTYSTADNHISPLPRGVYYKNSTTYLPNGYNTSQSLNHDAGNAWMTHSQTWNKCEGLVVRNMSGKAVVGYLLNQTDVSGLDTYNTNCQSPSDNIQSQLAGTANALISIPGGGSYEGGYVPRQTVLAYPLYKSDGSYYSLAQTRASVPIEDTQWSNSHQLNTEEFNYLQRFSGYFVPLAYINKNTGFEPYGAASHNWQSDCSYSDGYGNLQHVNSRAKWQITANKIRTQFRYYRFQDNSVTPAQQTAIVDSAWNNSTWTSGSKSSYAEMNFSNGNITYLGQPESIHGIWVNNRNINVDDNNKIVMELI